MIQNHADSEHIADVSGDVLEAQVAKLRALFPDQFPSPKPTSQNHASSSGVGKPVISFRDAELHFVRSYNDRKWYAE